MATTYIQGRIAGKHDVPTFKGKFNLPLAHYEPEYEDDLPTAHNDEPKRKYNLPSAYDEPEHKDDLPTARNNEPKRKYNLPSAY